MLAYRWVGSTHIGKHTVLAIISFHWQHEKGHYNGLNCQVLLCYSCKSITALCQTQGDDITRDALIWLNLQHIYLWVTAFWDVSFYYKSFVCDIWFIMGCKERKQLSFHPSLQNSRSSIICPLNEAGEEEHRGTPGFAVQMSTSAWMSWFQSLFVSWHQISNLFAFPQAPWHEKSD